MRLAAAIPDRIGAGGSFHGAGLAGEADHPDRVCRQRHPVSADGRGELAENRRVALRLRDAGIDLRTQALDAHHHGLQIAAVDGAHLLLAVVISAHQVARTLRAIVTILARSEPKRQDRHEQDEYAFVLE